MTFSYKYMVFKKYLIKLKKNAKYKIQFANTLKI